MSDGDRADVLIVGAGHAGVQVAAALRERGFTGSIVLFEGRPDWPFRRPPLTKELLSPEDEPRVEPLLEPARADDLGLGIRLASTVVEVDADRHVVRLADGDSLAYGQLVWTAGGVPRGVPGADLPSVINGIRTPEQARAVRRAVHAGASAVIIGAGFVGLEAASALAVGDGEVTVVERSSRILDRAGEVVAGHLRRRHESHGVTFLTDSPVLAVESRRDGTVVRLEDGRALEADTVVLGLGIVPAVDVLHRAGAMVSGRNGGVVTDALGRTSLPDVFAAGDCADFPTRYSVTGRARHESVQNAHHRGLVVAAAVAGQQPAEDAVPWFWTHQLGARVRMVGSIAGHDRCVLRQRPGSDAFSAVYLRRGSPIGVETVNATRDFAQARKLLTAGSAGTFDPVVAADPERDLSDAVH